MPKLFTKSICLSLVIILLALANNSSAEPIAKVGTKERCSVCGMFVAKYQEWICQIHFKDSEPKFFNGVKDAFAFYFQPGKFGGDSAANISELWGKDYYSLQWIDMKKAFYVMGSDVYGPMGHELIPFGSNKGATAFKKDHHGKKILTFAQITPEIITSLRSGHMMK